LIGLCNVGDNFILTTSSLFRNEGTKTSLSPFSYICISFLKNLGILLVVSTPLPPIPLCYYPILIFSLAVQPEPLRVLSWMGLGQLGHRTLNSPVRNYLFCFPLGRNFPHPSSLSILSFPRGNTFRVNIPPRLSPPTWQTGLGGPPSGTYFLEPGSSVISFLILRPQSFKSRFCLLLLYRHSSGNSPGWTLVFPPLIEMRASL